MLLQKFVIFCYDYTKKNYYISSSSLKIKGDVLMDKKVNYLKFNTNDRIDNKSAQSFTF